MASYVVMEPPAAGEVGTAERAVLVRDGFSFLAFILPVVWLLWRRLWIEAILVLAASIALVALSRATGLGFVGGAVSLLVSLYVGLEGQSLRIGALRRRGWREWGVVEGGTMAEAEIRYLAGPAPQGDAPQRAAPEAERRPAPTVQARPAPAGPALGMLGYPGRH